MRGGKNRNTGLARRLRRNSTDAGHELWRHLRARSVAGHKFVRRHPLGQFVADFVRRVTEVDGGQHGESAGGAARDQWLHARICRVFRFWNNDVTSNLDCVLHKIAEALGGEAPPHPLAASGER
ncbi:MAG TPA: DUF559 domain-containing protein [Pseudolabrys sp.]|nr:DUF559 domain-containing protein [Pseudolabrys sp.]